MQKNKKTSVIIVAGGVGKRIGGELPKQYLQIGGETILEKTIKAFYSNSLVDNICVVIAKEHEQLFKAIKQKFERVEYCFGGVYRQDSVHEGLKFIEKYAPDNVLIHDAARPFVSEKIINDVIKTLENNQAVLPAVKVKDTIKFVENNFVKNTPERDKLFAAQTPQGFSYNKIFELHKKYSGEDFSDDCALFEKENLPVKIIEGDYANYKITTKEDMTKHYRTGSGFDVHQFEDGDGIILCGIKIAYNKKLKGHSDADCAWHALTDALLGAVGLGDIGEHFPDTDAKWKGADSGIFLQHSYSLITAKGGELINADITVICEEPKLKIHKKTMAENTAKLLNLPADRINIKATTTEKLGFLGRKEGLACMASVSVLI
jgi:2-C-methyl-D-erythritol 4-phosphate cytidylyltransferase/2-C-methyl-D-erythritol 2,4-cyclodiphosphate synthase